MVEEALAVTTHKCHIPVCEVPVPPEYLMCAKHWYMVPKAIRDEVWRTYRPGQCDDKQPSKVWFQAATTAIDFVMKKITDTKENDNK